MSPLRAWVVRLGYAAAVLGPVGGALALWFGNLAFWGADVPHELPPVLYTGIYLGTVPTAACIGLLLASPLRLFSAMGVQRDAWWGWPLLALTAIVGLGDLSIGVVHTVLIMVLWAKEGPGAQESPNGLGTTPGTAGDNLPQPDTPLSSTP